MSIKEKLEFILEGLAKAKLETFTDHPIANFIRNELLQEVDAVVKQFNSNYETRSSAGAGNWASVPWLSILNPAITSSTQSGVYPVYLFCADGSGVYLSLGFGTTELKDKYGTVEAKSKAQELRETIRHDHPQLMNWDDEIQLHSNTTLGRSYEWATAGAKLYLVEDIPDDETLISDLKEMLEIYSSLENTNENKKNSENKPTILNYLPNPFILLAGISGTGKSRFVRKQAIATGSLSETYCLVSVRPDWHEPSDLLGYISRLSGRDEYVTTEVLQFIVKAWRAIVDGGLDLSTKNIHGERLVVSGTKAQLDGILPYWLCLDEMNLAPVEQYFADYLSVLETREWIWQEGGEFNYLCDALLKPAAIAQLESPDKLRSELGLTATRYDALWAHFSQHGIGIPFNLMVAGTVNMDETTHGFSRKVLDRALSFDFGEFFPNDFDTFFKPSSKNKTLSYPIFSHAKLGYLPSIDTDGQKSIDFLKSVNTILINSPFQLAYRALNELLLSIASLRPETENELQAVWDDFLMCKVLPRIEGDVDKLAKDNLETSLLAQLIELLATELPAMRPDLYREHKDDSVIMIANRSQAKLHWMQDRLLQSGFTSFWP